MAKKRNQSFDVGDFHNIDKVLPSGGRESMDGMKSSMMMGGGNNGNNSY
jgi:hypothetical protein